MAFSLPALEHPPNGLPVRLRPNTLRAAPLPRRRAAETPRTFSLADTGRLGCTLRLTYPQLHLGLGTTGGAVIDGCIKRFLAEHRSARRPRSLQYLLVDAATAPAGVDTDCFRLLPGGGDGAGTDPREGYKRFTDPENLGCLRGVLHRQLDELEQIDPALPWEVHPRTTTVFWIAAGIGATGGGSLHAAIDLVNDVARERGIRQPRVRVLQIGAEIALRDRSRRVIREQELVVRDTAANNLTKLLGDMAASAEPYRVWSILVADQSNGPSAFASTQGLVRMLGNALFLRCFTEAGKYLDDRIKDHDQLGASQRNRNVEGEQP